LCRPLYGLDEYEKALERARPSEGERLGQDRYLEEIHLSALANVLRRPIWVLADGCRVFLPLRHEPQVRHTGRVADVLMGGWPELRGALAGQDVKLATGDSPRPLVIAHFVSHYVPLCLTIQDDFWTWIGRAFPGDTGIEQAFR
jgi:hypothetical protein